MIAETLPSSHTFFRGSSGSKSKVGCIAIRIVWTTGMLVAAEDRPDKRAGALTSSKIILNWQCGGLNSISDILCLISLTHKMNRAKYNYVLK